MATPSDLRVSESHEWFRVDGSTVTIGITQFAADELTDVTYVEMRSAGDEIDAGGSVGEVESVKTTSEIFSAVGGTVAEVNEKVVADPSLVNSDPYGDGWLVRLNASDTSPLDGLMDAASYDASHG